MNVFDMVEKLNRNPTLALYVVKKITETEEGTALVKKALLSIINSDEFFITTAKSATNFIEAIKAVRILGNLPIKEAKDFVELHVGRGHWPSQSFAGLSDTED